MTKNMGATADEGEREAMKWNSIVCGVTGSDLSRKAAREAAGLAEANGAELAYVYAVDSSFLRGGKAMGVTTEAVEESLAHLGRHFLDFAEEIAAARGVRAKKILRRGLVLDVLKGVISEEKADLLVLGHEERTLIEKAFVRGEVEEFLDDLKEQTGVEVLVIE